MLGFFLISLIFCFGVKYYIDVVQHIKKKKTVWVSIEGIIGAGKTTLIKNILPHLEEKYGENEILVVDEPVKQWIESGHLEKCTTEPYVAQTFFFHTRVERFIELLSQRDDSNLSVIISERSMISDRYVFWDTTCLNGGVTELAQKTYPALWNTWSRLLKGNTPDLYIYLELDVETSQARMRSRNRSAEQEVVSKEYQKQLLDAHERVFFSKDGKYNAVRISSAQNFKDDTSVAKDISDRIIRLIEHERIK